jgi:hypothetical protein
MSGQLLCQLLRNCLANGRRDNHCELMIQQLRNRFVHYAAKACVHDSLEVLRTHLLERSKPFGTPRNLGPKLGPIGTAFQPKTGLSCARSTKVLTAHNPRVAVQPHSHFAYTREPVVPRVRPTAREPVMDLAIAVLSLSTALASSSAFLSHRRRYWRSFLSLSTMLSLPGM